MKLQNKIFVSGIVVSGIRWQQNKETGDDQADFKIESTELGKDGKQYKEAVLCRVMGIRAQDVKDLPLGTKVFIEGTLRYAPNKMGYVEVREIDI